MSFLGEPPTAASAPAASAPPAAPAAPVKFWQPWSVDSEPSKKKRKDIEGEPENEIASKIDPEHERKVKCPHCSLFLSSRGSLYNHIKVKHSHELRWICDQCGVRQKRLSPKAFSQTCPQASMDL